MKCTIPEISWHNRDPVLSVDIQPATNEGFYRLATGGTDSHVLIWHLKILETGATTTESVSDLTRHQRAVNVVRWSHSGQYLASGDDDANIIIWHQKIDDLAVMLDGDNDDTEKWSVLKVLRGHKEDVYDICWSPDSNKLISGSVDNTAIIWDLNKGLNDNILTDHKGFVQGVTWDPLGQYVATLSSDRFFRVFNDTGKQVKARVKKGQLSVPESHVLYEQNVRYFHDDTLKSFFRRLTFSPDGSFIITPSGCLDEGPNNKKLYTSYIYSISSMTQPAAILPSPGQYTVAARCCPVLFQLRPDGPDSQFSLPYRIVFAIATRSSVVLYDTQQMCPFATISNIHYTRLTDLTWSQDGRLLAVSSTDGFCSLVSFEPDELGVEYVKEPEVMEQDQNETLNETLEDIMETSLNISIDEKKEKGPSFLQKWTKKVQVNEEKSSLPDEKSKQKDEKLVSKIEVRRKPRVTTELNQNKSDTDKKEEKPISIIEIRRKSKTVENKDEPPKTEKKDKDEKTPSIIAVRRKPRESVENKEVKSSADNNEVNIDKKLFVNKENIEQITENSEAKDNRENKSCAMEVDDIIIIEPENEKENKNKENVLSQNENPTKLKIVNESIATPDSKKKLALKSDKKKTPNSTPTSNRKKPKEPPGGQLNITQFLKSAPKSTTPKAKSPEISKKNPFILLADYSKTGQIYPKSSSTVNSSEVIIIDDNSTCDIPPLAPKSLDFEEDTQNIKLVLEETVDEPVIKLDKEKMDEDIEANKNNSSTERLKQIANSSKDKIDNSQTSKDNKKEKNEEIIIADSSEDEITNIKDKTNGKNEILIADSKEDDITNKVNKLNGDISTENCDTKKCISKSEVEIKEAEKPTPLSNVLTPLKGSPAKRRVPLITLSSPKHKKKV